MRFFNWIISLFKKEKKEEPKTPELPTPTPAPTIPSAKKILKIAIVRGHGGNDSGAVGCGTNEVEYNTWVMKEIEKLNLPNVRCFYGDNSLSAVLKSLPFFPDLTIQLHLNSASAQAQGCEVLVIDGDLKSYPFAEKFASMFCKKFNRLMRGNLGKKILGAKDRGLTSLKASTFGAKILVEPWFISNINEYLSKEDYLEFLKEFIKGAE